MRATKNETPKSGQKITVDTTELKALLSCGRTTAEQIGTAAGARIQLGRRVLWNLSKIQQYLNGERGA